jgi:hypothetical protein
VFPDEETRDFFLRHGPQGGVGEHGRNHAENLEKAGRFAEAAHVWHAVLRAYGDDAPEAFTDCSVSDTSDYSRCRFLTAVMLGLATDEGRREAMRRFFRMAARTGDLEGKICDSCATPLSESGAFRNGNYLRCSDCTDRTLQHWREAGLSPDYFGDNEVMQAAVYAREELHAIFLSAADRA